MKYRSQTAIGLWAAAFYLFALGFTGALEGMEAQDRYNHCIQSGKTHCRK